MTDNKGRIFGKINIIDICVVVILIIAVAATYFKFNMSAHSDVTTSNGRAEYTILAKGLRSFTVDQFEIGDKVFDKESEKCIGEVVAVETAPAYEYITKTDGNIVHAQMPERYDLRVTVQTDAVINDKGINANSAKFLYLNQNSTYYTQTVQVEAKLVDLKIIE